MNITEKIIFEKVRDLNLKHIFECGQCFRWNASDSGTYIGIVNSFFCRASFKEDRLILDVTGGSREFWYSYFDLGRDYGRIKSELIIRDKKLAPAIEYGSGIRILNQDFFEILISFIISQNNNIPRIKKCIESICLEYGKQIYMYEGKAYYSFPSADRMAEIPEKAFEELKLGYRSNYLTAAVDTYRRKGEPIGCYEDKMDELLSYKGIGPKVANCILLFGLSVFEAFPIDVWVKKLMHDLYGFEKNDKKGIEKYAEEHFKELGGIAQQYLFYYYRDL